MDLDELKECFEKHEDEHGEFERIPVADRLHPRPDICGMLKLDQIDSDDGVDIINGADHDVIFFACDDDKLSVLTEEDVIYLRRCGIFYNEEYDALCAFV